MKNSVGIWAFGPAVTRFVPPGYHHEVAGESMTEKTRRVCEGLSDILDGLEYHYPGEINEENVEEVTGILRDHGMDLPVVAAGLHTDPTYSLGAFINPDPSLRRKGIDTLKRGMDLASEVGANFIIWPGAEGYNYPFQRPYAKTWQAFVEAIAELTDHANGRGIKVFLEHKNSEPAMQILMKNIGMTLFVIHKVEELGVDTENLLVNMDWQHLIMNGENLAEYAALLASENRLGHQHANDGWGTFDDDNVVGTNFFMQTLELARTLQDTGYGENGERVGFDLYPYTEDQVAAVRRAILHWEFIWELAKKIDGTALKEARERADALSAQKAVYEALGLDEEFEQRVVRARREGRSG
ncbi:D-apiose isomerase [Rubrobacter xylanophilus DSM 9941]|uniref:TIM barrel protein n=1 Tax=Rubrobacter xylanophilus TaxID=49319 RepID=UPI001C64056C|nr:TIM barrel protein [Rubrobacter xylanophilus]QYJ16636.1 D-apiose isomerase [Rubrobacter xylanophilus DSM 9941]